MWPIADRPLVAAFDPLQTLDLLLRSRNRRGHANAFSSSKPLHGWREFLGEVGIIVIGVLVALTAEQLVEWVHWRNAVADARRALDREVAYNLGAVEKRQQEAACIDRRLREIRSLLTGTPPAFAGIAASAWAAATVAASNGCLASSSRGAGSRAHAAGDATWLCWPLWRVPVVRPEGGRRDDAWSVLAELDDPGTLARRTSRR